MPTVGECPGADFARQDRRARAADSPQADQHLPLPFDCRLLRVGGVAFLFGVPDLFLDQLEASIFALQFASQTIEQRMTFRRPERLEVDPGRAPLQLDPPNALGKEKAPSPVDMPGALPDETLSFAMRAACVLLFDRWHADCCRR